MLLFSYCIFQNQTRGCSQGVKATDFDSVTAGSNPSIPASPFQSNRFGTVFDISILLCYCLVTVFFMYSSCSIIKEKSLLVSHIYQRGFSFYAYFSFRKDSDLLPIPFGFFFLCLFFCFVCRALCAFLCVFWFAL